MRTKRSSTNPNFEPLVVSQEKIPDGREIFGNSNPIQVEIGPGKGEFLIERARQEPQVNFVGIEIRRKRVEHIQAKIEKSGLKNIFLFWANAKEILPHLFTPSSVHAFFIHFPDPWPKRKHEHRRLVDSSFVEILYTLLVSEGKVYLTTDSPSYAQTILETFVGSGKFLTIYVHHDNFDSVYHHSIHEWKFKLQNRPIHYFCFSKPSEQMNEGGERKLCPLPMI